MILCEREIQALVRRGLVVIDPCPSPDSKRWSSTALDLTLHKVVLEWKPMAHPPTGGAPQPIRPKENNFNVQQMMEDATYARRIDLVTDTAHVLSPGRFLLGFTEEKVRFPHECRIAARVEGKSSLARIGLGVHVTAPTIHAGFGAEEGKAPSPIQLEIFNLGPYSIRLDAGMRICQLILEEVREVPSLGYEGQFGGQQQFTVPE
jgi:dCTP deaminase